MDEPVRSNRDLWDAWTRIHVGSAFYDVESFRTGERPIRVADYERDEVGSVEGRTLLHLQCHFGLDTLSWARLGATVTGVDFSEEAVTAAQALAADIGVPARFVVSDIVRPARRPPRRVRHRVHVVRRPGVAAGHRGWGRVAAHFVRPGGFLYLTEIHPVALAFDDEGVAPGELRLAYPYWSHREPIRTDGRSYADPAAPTDGLVGSSWDHSLGEIVTSLADAGLRLEFLHEFDFVRWPMPFLVEGQDGRWRLPDDTKGELPLFFSLKATKP